MNWDRGDTALERRAFRHVFDEGQRRGVSPQDEAHYLGSTRRGTEELRLARDAAGKFEDSRLRVRRLLDRHVKRGPRDDANASTQSHGGE